MNLCSPALLSRRLTLLTVTLLTFYANAASSQDASDDSTFEERADAIIRMQAESKIDWDEENSFKMAHFVAQARFAVDDMESGQAVIRRAIEVLPLTEYYDAEFPLWSTMDCYMRWKDVPGAYTPELKRMTQEYVAAATAPSDATTYNHHWMLASGLALAYQEWGDEVVSYKYSENDPSGRDWIFAQLDRIVHQGHPETLAETYSHFEIGAILSLLNFYEDEELKQQAKMTLDWIMLHRASYNFHGHTAGATRRTYAPIKMQNNSLSPNWLLFAGPELTGRKPYSRRPSVCCALSEYRPPTVCMTLIRDHEYPFSVVSSISDFRTERFVSHFEKDYVLFSTYNVKNNLGPRSSYHHERLSWAVRWNAPPDRFSTFMIKQPCPKYDRMPYLGDTHFHQMLQHKRTLIGIVNSPTELPLGFNENSWRTHLLGVGPQDAEAIIDESATGRLYLHYGPILIAVKTTRPFETTVQGDLMEFEIPAAEGRLTVGYVVETAPADEYPGESPEDQLAMFAGFVSQQFDELQFEADQEHPKLTYRTLENTDMQLSWRPKGISSVREIDGRPIPNIEDNQYWPLLRTPYIEQLIDGNLTLHTDENSTVYDFDSWRVSTTP